MLAKNVYDLDQIDLQKFLDGIENIILDVDGVVWTTDCTPIDGISKTLRKLRQLKKNIYFATNNNLIGFSKIYRSLTELIPDLPESHVLNPTLAMISYLKNINFDKEIFICGTDEMKEEFRKAGFTVADSGPALVTGNHIVFISEMLKNLDNVGAVIIDIDVNLNLMKLTKMLNCLKHENVLFLSGAKEKRILKEDVLVIAQGEVEYLIEGLIHRKSICFGKPEEQFKKYLQERFNLNPSTTLFVGDMLDVDINLGKSCGFQTLLVLTGTCDLNELHNCPTNYLPDFYLESFGHLSTILENKLNL